MKNIKLPIKFLAMLILSLAFTTLAQAQATRTWVSGVGDDLNPCSRTAPCKSFAGAVTKTAVAGEIDVLDGGGYGSVTLTKSMTIDGGPGLGSILANGVTGVTVNIVANANDPERRVTLRRLSINGTGAPNGVGQRTGLRGINFLAGQSLYVEDSYIQNFTLEGIRVSMSETGSYLSVKNTNIQNANIGISTATSTGYTLLAADKVRLEKMTTNGITLGTHAFASVRDSFIINNGADGISMTGTNTDGRALSENNMISHNIGNGIKAGGAGSGVVISNTTLQYNSTALATGGGTVGSHQNNRIDGGAPGVAPAMLGQQ